MFQVPLRSGDVLVTAYQDVRGRETRAQRAVFQDVRGSPDPAHPDMMRSPLLLHTRWQNYLGGLMLVLPCFPEIARRGFAKFARADLAKLREFCTPNFPQTPRFAGQNKKGGNAKA